MKITLVLKNHTIIGFAPDEHIAKYRIMAKLEKHPEWYGYNPEEWWEKTGWNVKDVYSFKEVENI